MPETNFTYYSPRLDADIPARAYRMMDKRRRGTIGVTEYYRRMRKAGLTAGQADTLYGEFIRGELIITIEVEAPFTRCEVVKYFNVIIRNPRRTAPIKFEVRAELTLPTEQTRQREGETEEEWERRFGEYLEDKVEPVMDRALERWGNQERTQTRIDGKVERWLNTLDLDNFEKSLPITGVEMFEDTGTFQRSTSFGITKYKNDRITLAQTYDQTVNEKDLV